MNRSKILKIVAGSLAGVALGGALIYYNFVDKEHAATIDAEGLAPDFTVQTYKVENGEFETGGEDFQLSKQNKVTVVNFWETWCGACIEELPDFNRLQEFCGEYVEVVALAGATSKYENLATWLSTNGQAEGWDNFSLTFGWYDKTDNDVYATCGFSSGTLPATMIVNDKGEIVYHAEGAMTREALREHIEPLLPLTANVDWEEFIRTTHPSEKNWWKENALGVTFLAISTAALGTAIVVSAVSTAKKKKKQAK